MGRRSLASQTALTLQARLGSTPFTLAEARAAGVTPSQLRAAVAAGTLVHPHRGMYCVAGPGSPSLPLDPTIAARAVAHRLPNSAVSHSSAALLHGLPVPRRHESGSHVTLPGSRARVSGTVTLHASPLPVHHATVVGGTRVTTLARTAIDIARSARVPEALICMDATLRRLIDQACGGGLSLRMEVHDPDLIGAAYAHVLEVLEDMRGWPGTRNARRALEMADPAAESALESESRGVLIEQGVPRPECGFPVEGADGRTYWADMVWEDRRVIGECDGLIKYSQPEVLYREKLRQEALERAGWRVVRWTHADIARTPTRVAERVLHALGQQAA